MSDNSSIEWTDATWNIGRGCRRVSPGCEHCYAERQANRQKGAGGAYEGLVELSAKGPRWTGESQFVADALDQPLRWRKPRRIFVNSMSDLFYDGFTFEQIAAVFGVMAAARQHTFQVLTKRIGRALEFYRWIDGEGRRGLAAGAPSWERAVRDLLTLATIGAAGGATLGARARGLTDTGDAWPLPNVWLGASVEDQKRADERIPALLRCPAAVRFLSVEPLLERVSLSAAMRPCWACGRRRGQGHDDGCAATAETPRVDWVIVGGESGPGARPMHPAWARSIRDQCVAAGVPFFFKQWGEWAPTAPQPGGDLGGDMRRGLVQIVKPCGENNGRLERGDALVRRVGKGAAGRLLDGRPWDEMPAARHG